MGSKTDVKKAILKELGDMMLSNKMGKVRLAAIDMVAVGLMYFLLLVSFYFTAPWLSTEELLLSIAVIAMIYFACNYLFGCYRFALDRIGVYEYIRQCTSTICAGGAIAVLNIVGVLWLPAFGLVVMPIITGSIFWGIRFIYQIDLVLKSKIANGRTSDIKRVLIYGAGSRGAYFASSLIMKPEEKLIPVREDVRAACEILGLDPFQVACEGRFAVFLPEREVEKALAIMRAYPSSVGACRIGKVTDQKAAKVLLKSTIGAQRILDMSSGEQLPRIC
jgi:FlaA1/EpsC-like NDP-sugar epimerase